MKDICDVIKDLLLIYKEDEVSEDTREFVEEHLKGCEECRTYYEQINKSIDAVEELKNEETEEAKKNEIIKKSFGKIKKRWIASILCVIILVPVLGFAGRMTKNQIEGNGLRFSNFDEVLLCKKYLKNIKNEDFEAVYDMMDVTEGLHNVKEAYYRYTNDENIGGLNDIKLNGSDWCIRDAMFEENTFDENNDQAFWQDVINNYRANILIPENVWDSIVPEPYIAQTVWFGTELKYYYVSKDKLEEAYGEISPYENQGFIYLETKWGNYYTYGEICYTAYDNGAEFCIGADQIIESANDAIRMFWYMNILPKEIVEEAQKEIKAENAEALEKLQTQFGNILDMTDSEYKEYIKSEYEKAFKSFWDKGYSITDISYIDKDQTIEVSGYDETIVMHIEVEDKNGSRKSGKITLGVKDGKIVLYDFESSSDVLKEMIREIIDII